MYFVKRFAVAMLAGTAAAVAGLVASAALGLPTGLATASSVGRAEGSAPGCDHDGLGTSLRTAFDAAIGYTVTAVVVDGIDGRCAGHQLGVALTDLAGRVSTQGGPLPVPAGSRSLIVPVPEIPVEEVARVHTLLH
jgi:hypothetical protein